MAKYSNITKDGKCIFCEIAKETLPSYTIWEDSDHLAFLSIDPNTLGVTVVIPKKHFDSDPLIMPDDNLEKLITASKKVGNIIKNYFNDTEKVGFIIEGLGINHMHVKLYPMHGTANISKDGKWKQILSNEDVWFDKYEGFISSQSGPIANKEELKKLAYNIRDSNLIKYRKY